VQRAERLHRALHRLARFALRRDVSGEREIGLDPALVEIDAGNLRAGLAKRGDDRAADAACRAGDDGALALQ
jgi:hypothetical protein